ncbi:dihydroneopterin aldolase [Methylopila capsulata]|uniref:7,8-dihydroneopterin aldolase n=1 Tax=Methylopila capsulata TaxID=61654 RepID=A0A9W6IT21_9HYPH|nr:dihydroneopterin aldolase [Methylopila capsulata]MBM7849842.1 dihydroneopterin aldolase [Methylopila capsulata]GLK55132.1 dihydroneopterin aldolase [Methylopila capsulata]
MSDRIFLRGVQLHARHGVFEEERRLGQRFIVDVDYWVDMTDYARTDDFRGAVSYNDVYLTLMEIAGGEPVNLIETLAERIAAALLTRFAPIEVVRVQVHKPSAPIAGVFGDVGVDITRRRGGA